MNTTNRLYVCEDGAKVPLYEADYPMEFFVYRKHRRSAVIGDPKNCIEAKGICELHGVKEARVGSGKDAYVVFNPNRSRDHAHALHFIIHSKSGRIRDIFEQNKSISTQPLTLEPATDGQTLEHRNMLNKRRRRQIRSGEATPTKRDTKKPRKTRMMRIGVSPRPRATIVKNVVSLG